MNQRWWCYIRYRNIAQSNPIQDEISTQQVRINKCRISLFNVIHGNKKRKKETHTLHRCTHEEFFLYKGLFYH